MKGPHGLLVVDKPRGRTSHDIVADARRRFATRSVGHAGTLDPMATGALVLLFGEACKLSGHLSGQEKRYRATVSFGVATDSLDADGVVSETRALAPGWLDASALAAALDHERERSSQVPPNVSAIHADGERAHVRVRRGESFELPPRPVRVHAIELIAVHGDAVELELSVSKGYYVRSLARDLGETLGVPAHLSALRRLASGPFTLAEACAWPPDAPPMLLGCADVARRALPVTELSVEGVRSARHGKVLDPQQAAPSQLEALSAWLSPDGKLVALGISSSEGHRVVRGFAPDER